VEKRESKEIQILRWKSSYLIKGRNMRKLKVG